MTVREFFKKLNGMAGARVSLDTYADSIMHKTREDKFFREEYLPISAVLHYLKIPLSDQIELGNETEPWDALISGSYILEITQALPKEEHKVRCKIPAGLDLNTFINHASDAKQFPGVIIDAINKKVQKGYADERILAVVVSGDYTMEDDGVINSWIPQIQAESSQGNFTEILLVERDRHKVFKIF